jgi:hypothetical protein
MTTNPNISQGTINLARASVSFPDASAYNITASYVGEGGVSITFDTDAATLIPTLTGAVQSQAVYQMATITIHGLTSQSITNSFKARMQNNCAMGECVVRGDSSVLDSYTFQTATLTNVRDVTFNGKSTEFAITIRATYQVNSDLWA